LFHRLYFLYTRSRVETKRVVSSAPRSGIGDLEDESLGGQILNVFTLRGPEAMCVELLIRFVRAAGYKLAAQIVLLQAFRLRRLGHGIGPRSDSPRLI
jgi:hypothetical protein